MALNEQKKRFADKYFESLKGSESAIYAGYSEKTAKQIAYNLLQEPEVEEYLSGLRAEASEKSAITREWIVERFKHISDACVKAKPVMQWDSQSKSFVAVFDDNGDPVYEFDSSGANTATAHLGKIIGVFEKDNSQKIPETQIPIVNVYNTAPPLNSSESEIDAK